MSYRNKSAVHYPTLERSALLVRGILPWSWKTENHAAISLLICLVNHVSSFLQVHSIKRCYFKKAHRSGSVGRDQNPFWCYIWKRAAWFPQLDGRSCHAGSPQVGTSYELSGVIPSRSATEFSI